MSGLARRLPFRIIAGRHARLRGSEGLRGSCLTALIALVAQFTLGMILNLYVTVPSSDAHASYLQEVEAGPFALTVHALLGVLLICAAVVLLVRAIGIGNPAITALAAMGLSAILGAFAAGEIFVRNGQNSASLWMALLTGVALVSYITALNLLRVVPGQPAHNPRYAPRPPYSAQHPRPPWHDGPVPRPRPPFGVPPSDGAWDIAPW
jgi:quinol-cytochrome oxidoreductase complex cytochrome b subunit